MNSLLLSWYMIGRTFEVESDYWVALLSIIYPDTDWQAYAPLSVTLSANLDLNHLPLFLQYGKVVINDEN